MQYFSVAPHGAVFRCECAVQCLLCSHIQGMCLILFAGHCVGNSAIVVPKGFLEKLPRARSPGDLILNVMPDE